MSNSCENSDKNADRKTDSEVQAYEASDRNKHSIGS
jgi:hypothetical protein